MTQHLPSDRQEFRAALTAAIAAESWWWRRARHHQQESQRWQRRIELAERRGEADLATEAARRARHHAALARAAELSYAEQRARVQLLKQEARTHDLLAQSRLTRPFRPPQESPEDRLARLERESLVEAQLRELKARLAPGPK